MIVHLNHINIKENDADIIGIVTSFQPILRLVNIDTAEQITFAKLVLRNRGYVSFKIL